MSSKLKQIVGSRVGKASAVAALSVAAIGLAAPTSSATAEANWTAGCRGYWYSTSGHAYCSNAQRSTASLGYDIIYDCNVELDEWDHANPGYGYTGKISTYECTFKINSTRVY